MIHSVQLSAPFGGGQPSGFTPKLATLLQVAYLDGQLNTAKKHHYECYEWDIYDHLSATNKI